MLAKKSFIISLIAIAFIAPNCRIVAMESSQKADNDTVRYWNNVILSHSPQEKKSTPQAAFKTLIPYLSKKSLENRRSNLIGHPAAVTSVAFVAGTDLLISGCLGRKNNLIEWNGIHKRRAIENNFFDIQSISTSAQERKLAVSGKSTSKKIVILEYTPHGSLPTLSTFTAIASEDFAEPIALSSDGSFLLTGNQKIKNTFSAYDIKGLPNAPRHIFKGHLSDVTCFAWNLKGTKIASGSLGNKNNLVIWNPIKKSLRIIDNPLANIYSIAISPNGKWLAAGGENDIFLYNMGKPSEIDSVPSIIFKGHSGKIHSMAFHPLGTHLISASDSNMDNLIMWNLTDKKNPISTTVQGFSQGVTSLAFDSDGTTIAIGCPKANNNLFLIHLLSSQEISLLKNLPLTQIESIIELCALFINSKTKENAPDIQPSYNKIFEALPPKIQLLLEGILKISIDSQLQNLRSRGKTIGEAIFLEQQDIQNKLANFNEKKDKTPIQTEELLIFIEKSHRTIMDLLSTSLHNVQVKIKTSPDQETLKKISQSILTLKNKMLLELALFNLYKLRLYVSLPFDSKAVTQTILNVADTCIKIANNLTLPLHDRDTKALRYIANNILLFSNFFLAKDSPLFSLSSEQYALFAEAYQKITALLAGRQEKGTSVSEDVQSFTANAPEVKRTSEYPQPFQRREDFRPSAPSTQPVEQPAAVSQHDSANTQEATPPQSTPSIGNTINSILNGIANVFSTVLNGIGNLFKGLINRLFK